MHAGPEVPLDRRNGRDSLGAVCPNEPQLSPTELTTVLLPIWDRAIIMLEDADYFPQDSPIVLGKASICGSRTGSQSVVQRSRERRLGEPRGNQSGVWHGEHRGQ